MQTAGELVHRETEANLLELEDEESKQGVSNHSDASIDESEDDSIPSYVKERPRRGRPAFRPFDLPSRQPLKRPPSG